MTQGKLGTTHLHMKKQELIEHILDLLGIETTEVMRTCRPRMVVSYGLRKMARTDLVNLCSAIKTKLNSKAIQPEPSTVCDPAYGD